MENNSEKSAVNAGQSAAYPMLLPPHLEKKHEKLEMFWTDKRREMENVIDFKSNLLPRINRIKDHEDRQGSCELFIQELTLRSWFKAEENHRRILKKDDVTDVIMETDTLDFLLDDDADVTDGSAPNVVPYYVAESTMGVASDVQTNSWLVVLLTSEQQYW
ncbi:nuclear transcription factor Y subunit C-1-like [Solanum lycopersicum]|uniref:nuclear transcription factor Y subunit C-1-like n=1 Tax=Solanum lycopersicum TaxID=4081 RepID=UPI003748D806